MSTGFDVARILVVRDKLLQACTNYYGCLLAGDLFAQFATDLHQEINTVEPAAVANSLRHLAGRELTEEAGTELTWRLAGNLARLRQGQPVIPWAGQTEAEWVPVQITHVERRHKIFQAKKGQSLQADSKGLLHRRGIVVRLLFLGGLAAGRTLQKFWSNDFCDSVLKAAVGFARFNREKYNRSAKPTRYPFLDAQEFYRLRLQVYVEPTLCRLPDEVGFKEVRSTAATLAWSRQLITLRLRTEFSCPLDHPANFACYQCPSGLERCPAACRETTLQRRYCPGCQQAECYFDPTDSRGVCIDCAARAD